MGEEVDYKRATLSDFSIRTLPNKSAFCWKHFGELRLRQEHVEKSRLFCIPCLSDAKRAIGEDAKFASADVKSYAVTVSSTNLANHLREKHEMQELQSAKTTTEMVNKFFTIKPRQQVGVQTSKFSETLNRDILLWFARDNEPFQEVQGEGFKDFAIKYGIVRHATELPHPTTLSRSCMFSMYDTMLGSVKAHLKHSPAFGSLSLDCWTDNYRHYKYGGFTYHYVDDDFKLTDLTLRVSSMPESHTGDYIKQEIRRAVQLFDLGSKNLYLVRDEGANVKKACQLARLESRGCAGHAIHNLVMVDGIKKTPDLYELIQKCCKIVTSLSFKTNELAQEVDKASREALLDICSSEELVRQDSEDPIAGLEQEEGEDDNEANLFGLSSAAQPSADSAHLPSKFTTLKKFMPTRWHCALEMVRSIVKNVTAVNSLLSRIGKAELEIDGFTELPSLKGLVGLLDGFKEATTVLSGSNYATMNLLLLLRSELFSTLSDSAVDDQLVADLKSHMRIAFSKRLPVDDLAVTAALIDPRCNNLSVVTEYLDNRLTDKTAFLRNAIAKYGNGVATSADESASAADVPTGSKRKLNISQLAKKHCGSSVSATDEAEISAFLALQPSEVGEDDLVAFWKARRASFPRLARVAQAVLSIPATSTPVERVFSAAGLIVTAKRSQLTPGHLNMLVFIHDNYEFCKSQVKSAHH